MAHTVTITQTVTTSSSRSSTYPTAGTTTGTTQSTSSSESYTWSTTITATKASASYATASYLWPMKVHTICEAESNDWPWIVTSPGLSIISDNGASFTKTTISEVGSGGTSPAVYVSVTAGISTQALIGLSQVTNSNATTARMTVSQTITSFSSASMTSTTQTTSTSTYQMAGPASDSALLPYSVTRTVTISHTTSRTTQFTYTRTTTATNTFTAASVTEATTTSAFTSTFTSTNAAGTVPTTIAHSSIVLAVGTTQVVFSTSGDIASTTRSSSTSAGTIANSSTTVSESSSANSGNGTGNAPAQGGNSFTATNFFKENVGVTGPTPTVTAVTIGEGFQIWPLLGRTQSAGTNITANFSLIIPQAEGAFGTSLKTPLLDDRTVAFAIPGFSVTSQWKTSDSKAYITYQTTTGTVSSTATVSIALAGSVNLTLSNTRTTTQFGGYGWDSTASTSITNRTGVHLATIVDGTSWTTTMLDWGASTSFAVAPGQAIALQAVPVASSASSSASPNPYLNFPLHPVT